MLCRFFRAAYIFLFAVTRIYLLKAIADVEPNRYRLLWLMYATTDINLFFLFIRN